MPAGNDASREKEIISIERPRRRDDGNSRRFYLPFRSCKRSIDHLASLRHGYPPIEDGL